MCISVAMYLEMKKLKSPKGIPTTSSEIPNQEQSI
jgi:hypothetical protein